MYKFVAQRLRCSLGLCASMHGRCPWRSLYSVALSATYTVSVLDGHSPPLFRLRVLKGVIWVTFGHFGTLRDETFAGWASTVTVCPRVFPSLAIACHLLPLYRQGCCISLHGGLLSMFHGRLPSPWAVSHGDLSSIYVGWSGCLGVTIPLCPAVGLSAAGVGDSAGPPPSFLKWNLRHLLVMCRNLLFLPQSNHWRSWNELCWFYVWWLGS